jgi:hypothetical protein
MSDLRKRILLTIGMAPISALISFVMQKTLAAWGILDPFARDAGLWLRTNFGTSIHTAGVLWGIALTLTLLLYAASLILIWRSFRPAKTARFNKAPPSLVQVASSVPERPGPDMAVRDAATHIAATNGWDAASDEVWAALRQVARDGKITVWGRPDSAHLQQPYKPNEQIPPEHWRDYGFDFLRCMHSEDEARCRSEPDDERRHPLNKGYADLRLNRAQVVSLPQQIVSNSQSDASAFKITFGEAEPYFKTKLENFYKVYRTFNLKLENRDLSKAATGCKVYVTDIEPAEYPVPTLPLKDGFDLAAGDHIFIPLVTYGEAMDQTITPCGDSFMMICVPQLAPKPSADREHIVTVRATSLQTGPRDARCKIWVDRNGRLRIATVP